MKLILIACAYALTACGTTLTPEHSRERIFNLGIVSFVERIEAQPRAAWTQPVQLQPATQDYNAPKPYSSK